MKRLVSEREGIIIDASIELKQDLQPFLAGAKWADQNPVSETFTYSDQSSIQLEKRLKVRNDIINLCKKIHILEIKLRESEELVEAFKKSTP